METAPWPYFEQDERDAVQRVLESGRINAWTGDQTGLFEQEFARYSQTRFGMAVANGSVSLDMALRALGVSKGDEVVVTPRSYFASVSSIVLAGGTPVFADVDRDSQNITADSIAKVLTSKTKGILPVHLAGWPCDMAAIMELAGAHNLFVIEDCAQAHGAMIDQQPVGSFGEVGSFSFCQDKIMTTGGEGGMITLSDEELHDKMWSLRDHGKKYATVHRKDHPPGFRWLHESFGSNYRLTEMQSAIGRLQLIKLNDWRGARTRHAQTFNDAFKDLNGIRLTIPDDNITHAYYKYYVFVEPQQLKSDWDRDRIMREVTALGVPCFSGSCPEMYLEKAIQDSDFAPAQNLPVAKELGETSIMLLVHPTLTSCHIDRTVDAFRKVMQQAAA